MKAEKLILGNIYTMDEVKPVAKALTVAHGRIQYVGSVETARSLCGAKTEVLDYGENTIYPGFLEAHAHGVGKGIRLACHADVSAGTSYREYVQLMKEYIDAHPGKKFYMGAGWDVRFVEGDISFDRKALDAICPDVPCMLQAVDGHSSVCNTKLLEELGFDAEYARTRAAKGEMPVDADGNPTGRLIETPNAIATAHIPVTLDELKEGILAWQKLMFSKGYVGAVEAGNSLLSPQQDEAYRELSREGKLKLRAYSYYLMRESETDVEKTVRAAA